MATFTSIAPSKIMVSPIIITEPKIIHFIPDFDSNFLTFKDNFPFNFSNAQSVIIESDVIRISSSNLNPRQYITEVRKTVSKTLTAYPKNIIGNKFLIIDHSVIVNTINTIFKISETRALLLLFDYLKNKFTISKSKFEDVENVCLFMFNNNGLYELIYNNINSYKSKTKTLQFFDKWTLATVSNSTIPFLFYKGENIVIDAPALSRLKTQLTSINIPLE